MIVGVSTGCCFDLGLTRIEALRFIKPLQIDAVELMFAKQEELFDFNPSREDIAFLRSKRYVSIHAPFINIRYKSDAGTKKVLNALNSLALKSGARSVVFHVHHIKDFSLFKNFCFTPLAENMLLEKGKEAIFTASEAKDFLSTHKNFGFCVDIGHALKHGTNPADFLSLGSALKQAHVHFLREKKGEIRPHGAPSKAEKEMLGKSLAVLRSGIPLIAEWDFLPEETEKIAGEIELLRRIAAEK